MDPLRSDQVVCAIDPGNFDTAYCLLRGDGKILAKDKVSNDVFFDRLRNMVQLGHEGNPIRFCCETVASYGMAVGASVFETCFVIGRVMEIVGPQYLTLIVRLEVKLAICRSPKANDASIRTALIDQFGPPGTKKQPGGTYGFAKDTWAALALAETYRRGEYRPYVWSHLRAA